MVFLLGYFAYMCGSHLIMHIVCIVAPILAQIAPDLVSYIQAYLCKSHSKESARTLFVWT